MKIPFIDTNTSNFTAFVIDGDEIKQYNAILRATDAEGEHFYVPACEKTIIAGNKIPRLYFGGKRAIYAYKEQLLAFNPLKIDSKDYPSADLVHRFLCEEHAKGWVEAEAEHVESQFFKKYGKVIGAVVLIGILVFIVAGLLSSGGAANV